MPVQKRSINLGSMLEALVPLPSETSPPPPPLGFSQGESVMKKRKMGEEGDDEVGEQQVLPPIEPSKAKSPSQKGKSKNGRALQKAAGYVSHKSKHRSGLKMPRRYEFYIEGQPMDEEDSVLKSKEVWGGQVADVVGRALLLPKDMKIWQGNNSEHMVENLKRDSILVSLQTLYWEFIIPKYFACFLFF